MADNRELEQTASSFAEIAQILLAHGTSGETMHLLLDMAVRVIDGCTEAGLCAVDGSDAGSRPTSSVVSELDAVQTELGEGPCHEVLAGTDVMHVDDLAAAGSWPRFSAVAVEKGLRSLLALRLHQGDVTFAALQLYGREAGAFDADSRAQAVVFAAQAGVALSLASTQDASDARLLHLQAALLSREIIGQAQGILMERERITSEQAFTLLRKASQQLNLKLRDVAQGLVDTGLVPKPENPTD